MVPLVPDEVTEALDGPQLPAHLYVHVPFCPSKCDYCDFYSIAAADDDLVETVFTGIRSQIAMWAAVGLPGVLDTIYVGGGTPSSVAAQVARTLETVFSKLAVRTGAEVTVEANPDSLTSREVALLADAGATRLSVGVQSFDNDVLAMLGRRHDGARARAAAAAVVDAGLALSVDLMCGVPGQSMESWRRTLAVACGTGARHASVYPLALEDGTPLSVAADAGLVAAPDPDVQADMMIVAEDVLGGCGLHRYEVANYAVADADQSRHNLAYWTGAPYIGVGPGAHGMLNGANARTVGIADASTPGEARVRYSNAASIERWLLGKGDEIEVLDPAAAAREDVMLGLRLVRGVSGAAVSGAGLEATLESLAADGLVELDSSAQGGRWKTTRRGWLLGNEVFSRVWAGGQEPTATG
jgi:oxygen-independent coproporphyrinogen-3 oxidase